jgi:hypothetical protein
MAYGHTSQFDQPHHKTLNRNIGQHIQVRAQVKSQFPSLYLTVIDSKYAFEEKERLLNKLEPVSISFLATLQSFSYHVY